MSQVSARMANAAVLVPHRMVQILSLRVRAVHTSCVQLSATHRNRILRDSHPSLFVLLQSRSTQNSERENRRRRRSRTSKETVSVSTATWACRATPFVGHRQPAMTTRDSKTAKASTSGSAVSSCRLLSTRHWEEFGVLFSESRGPAADSVQVLRGCRH